MGQLIAKGVELCSEILGEGIQATKQSRVRYAARIFLRRGDEVTRDAGLIANNSGYLVTKVIDGTELVLHEIVLGKRQTIAGIEKALFGMKEGGFREIRVSSNLAYGKKGVPGHIPENALLRIKLWLETVERVSESG